MEIVIQREKRYDQMKKEMLLRTECKEIIWKKFTTLYVLLTGMYCNI